MSDQKPIRLPPKAAEIDLLDGAVQRCIHRKPISSLVASGATSYRYVRRSELLSSVLRVVETFVEERIRYAERELRQLLSTQVEEAQGEGRLRVLASLAEFADLLDSTIATATDESLRLPIRALDRRLDRIFQAYGFMRIPTVGVTFDPSFHEALDEEATTQQSAGVIVREISRGYCRDGLVLRVARVVIAAPHPPHSEI